FVLPVSYSCSSTTSAIYSLSLHDALPIFLVPPGEETALATELSTELGRGDLEVRRSLGRALAALDDAAREALMRARSHPEPEVRSEEHTSELQSREKLVCRLLLEKKKRKV